MPELKGPLFSLEARGSVAKNLTYSKRKSGQMTRKYTKPTKEPSAKQKERRRITDFLVAQWQGMSDAQKETWNNNTERQRLGITGYQYFLKQAQSDLYTYHNLIAYWSMNYIENGQILDLSGNDITGTLGPNYPTDAPQLTTSKNSKFGNGLLFNGNEQRVNLPTPTEITEDHDEFSMSAWFTWDDTAPEPRIAIITLDQWNSRIDLEQATKTLSTNYWFGTEYVNVDSITPLTTNKWYYATSTYDGEYVRIYVNGKLEGTSIQKIGTIINQGGNARIGAAYHYLWSWKGKIDEVSIYNRALTAEEIAARYRFGKTNKN